MTIATNIYAFPGEAVYVKNRHGCNVLEQQNGITIRDYFAATILPACYTEFMTGWRNKEHNGCDDWQMGIAVDAYRIASAMMEARK